MFSKLSFTSPPLGLSRMQRKLWDPATGRVLFRPVPILTSAKVEKAPLSSIHQKGRFQIWKRLCRSYAEEQGSVNYRQRAKSSCGLNPLHACFYKACQRRMVFTVSNDIPEAEKSETRVPAQSSSGGGPLPGWPTAAFSLSPRRARQRGEAAAPTPAPLRP